MGFQTRVNQQPPPAVAGDFAGTNPRTSVTAPPGGYQAAPNYPLVFGGAATQEALIVGRFAWFNYASDDSVSHGGLPAVALASNYFQPNSLLGFVHREGQTIITTFLADHRVGVQAGFPVTGMSQGDFWADFAPGPATVGQYVYADPVTGAASAAPAGQSVTVTGATGAIVAATGVMTIAGSPSTTVAVGQAVVGAGIPAGTFITNLISSTGGAGTVQLNQAPATNIGAESITLYGKQQTRWKLAQPVQGTATFTGQFVGDGTTSPGPFAFPELTVTGSVTNGPIVPGMLLGGTGVPSFATILGQKSGTPGGDGVYITNVALLQGSSEPMTGSQGTLGKISTWQA